MLLNLLVSLALIGIALTMLLRCHEINERGWFWNLRRVGLIVTGIAALGVLFRIWFGGSADVFWRLLAIGTFIVYFTTPNGVPWWKWVWKDLHDVLDPPAKLPGDR